MSRAMIPINGRAMTKPIDESVMSNNLLSLRLSLATTLMETTLP
jgi:hypothetical protein